MQFHRDASDGINVVSGYSDKGLLVGDELLQPPCVITLTALLPDWPVADIASLAGEAFRPVIALSPELILLGSGDRLVFPSARIGAEINRAGIGFEVMDNAAACRTYNVLAHEGRKVALALLAIEASRG